MINISPSNIFRIMFFLGRFFPNSLDFFGQGRALLSSLEAAYTGYNPLYPVMLRVPDDDAPSRQDQLIFCK